MAVVDPFVLARAVLASGLLRPEGFVYFLLASDGLIKIGWSTAPGGRIATLQTAHGRELVLLAVQAGARSLDRETKLRFAAARVRGEWFAATPELMAHIEGLKGKVE